MRWLVTAPVSADLSVVAERLAELGCSQIDVETAVPMGPEELSIAVDGPEDLDALVIDDPMLNAAFNDSDVVLYD